MEVSPQHMCFGLSEELDRASFFCYLKQVGNEKFARELSDRLSSKEIESFIENFTALMKKHLSEDEYHSLFLGQGSGEGK